MSRPTSGGFPAAGSPGLPARLGPYEVTGELGRGGAGVVLRARAPDGHEVAIKLLRPAPGATAARFARERALQAELGLPDGFVPLLDAGDGPSGPWLVLPLLPGGTLRDRLRRGPLDLDDALLIAEALARALGRAHERGIVHRDLTPENVLFTGDGEPLVADLGLAKLEGSGSLSVTGELRGTAGYMAPEQMEDAKGVGPPADVFALGAILYECLAGAPAFTGESAIQVIDRVVAGAVEPLARRRKDVPGWLSRLTARCLAGDPAARYPDGAALHAALVQGRASGRRLERVRPALVIGLALAVGVGLGVGLSSRGAPGPGPALGSPQAPAPAPAPAAPSPLGLARRALETHDLPRALDEVDRALTLAPDDLDALGLRGDVLLGLGRPREATAGYERVLARAPDRVDALQGRALARARLGDTPGALADLDRAIALEPGRASALALRAELRAMRGDDPGALADYDRVLAIAPDATSFRWRGQVRARHGDPQGGLADLDRAVALEPRDAGNYALRATVRHNMGDAAGAVRDYDRGLELCTDDGRREELHRERARSRYAKGDVEGALEDLGRALALAPTDPLALTLQEEVQAARRPPPDPSGAWVSSVQGGTSTLTVRGTAGTYTPRWDEPGTSYGGSGLLRAGRLLLSWGGGPTTVMALARDGTGWRAEWWSAAEPAPPRSVRWEGAELLGPHAVEGGSLALEAVGEAFAVTWRVGRLTLTGVGLRAGQTVVVGFGEGQYGCMEVDLSTGDEVVGRWIGAVEVRSRLPAVVQRLRRAR